MDKRREQVFLGKLPDDFLRFSPDDSSNTNVDITQCQYPPVEPQMNLIPRVNVSLIEATLVKNYGLLTKMDPYVRLRIGSSVLETHSAVGAGKNPIWNKTFSINLQPASNSLFIEIFDECSFTLDDKIAWTSFDLPEEIFRGKIFDKWIPLSGKQGDLKEGSIHIILSYSVVQVPRVTFIPAYFPMQGVNIHPYQYQASMTNFLPLQSPFVCNQQQTFQSTYCSNANLPHCIENNTQNFTYPQHFHQANPYQVNSEQTRKVLQELQEMFPLLDKSTIETILENNNYNKEITVNQLLSMS